MARTKIVYWFATGLLAFGMLAQGLTQILHTDGYVDMIVTHLGYPMYLLTILGVWKLLGVVAIMVPKFSLLKEWAYAGFFFVMTGALISHIAMGDPIKDWVPAILLLILIVVSWALRPADRKLTSIQTI